MENSCPLAIQPATNSAHRQSNSKRICLRHLACLPFGIDCQRLDGAGLIEMQNCVELLRQRRIEIMAQTFGCRPVDHSDRTFEPGFLQMRSRFTCGCEQEAAEVSFVEQCLVAAGKCGPHILAFGGSVPVGGGGHRAMMR